MLAITGTGATVADARAVAFHAADHIAFEGKTYRRDIAAMVARLAREEEP